MLSFKQIEKSQAITLNWLKEHKTNCIRPEDQKEINAIPGFKPYTSRDISRLEVYKFKKEKPLKYFFYVNEDKREVTTWTGEKLGSITAMYGKHNSNFGDVRIFLDIKGVNGIKYHAVYYKSAGDYARATAFKKQD